MCPAVPAIKCLIAILLLFVPAVLGQTVATARAADTEHTVTFSSGVANVRVDAQVTQNGDLVKDLTQNDFVVYDEGKQQPIVYFGHDSEPVTLLLLLDVSGSMREHIEQVADVAHRALLHMRDGDQVGIMLFSKGTKVVLPFTADLGKVSGAIRAAADDRTMSPYTEINNGLLEAAKYIDESAPAKGRRAILIITDNLGLNYQSPDQPVINALYSADTVLNALVVGKGERPTAPATPKATNPDFTPPDVFKISEETGGEAVKAAKASEVFPEMIGRIRTRYSLQFKVPENAAPGFHHVRVELTAAAQRRYPYAIVHARKGYITKS